MKVNNLRDNLVCVQCHGALVPSDTALVCESCNQSYPFIKDLVDFREQEAYWSNVSREKMVEMNDLARTSGDWLEAAEKIVPEYSSHFKPYYRADSQFLWPCTKDSRILDAGSMWGGITIPAAQFHGEVYAVDQTAETLEFLQLRAEQLGFDNIYTVACGLRKLPFPDDFFDLVVLSGVLEWVALQQEIVLEKQWGRFGRGLRPGKGGKYAEDPKSAQLRVLKELQRVIKPGGSLYFAIENRVGYMYLVGWPDDHMNIPFICFLPRFIANAVTKIVLKCEYRTYVYGIPGYRWLLKHSNFSKVDFYGAFTHYIRPFEIIPLNLIAGLKDKIIASKNRLHKTLLHFVPRFLMKWLAPSIIAIASKGANGPKHKARLVQVLETAGVLSRTASDVQIVKCDSRLDNAQTVNHWVYEGSTERPKYFCKVCRSIKDTDILETEARNLETVIDLFKDTKWASSFPRLAYFGTIDNVTFMATEYFEAKTSTFSNNRKLRTKLRGLDREIKESMTFLAAFQKHTETERVDAAAYLGDVVKKQKAILESRGPLAAELSERINTLEKDVEGLAGMMIPLCAQHGDYDFYTNILFAKDGIKVVDFEHFQEKALPFLDLATLIFNPILLSREWQKRKGSLADLLGKSKFNNYVRSWFRTYSELSGLSKDVLALLPALAALEQRTKEYPHYRDPETFPMNGAFDELISLRILFDE
jgi:ubiquinone/menaquinone biosynthesis C-methylase UbiE